MGYPFVLGLVSEVGRRAVLALAAVLPMIEAGTGLAMRHERGWGQLD